MAFCARGPGHGLDFWVLPNIITSVDLLCKVTAESNGKVVHKGLSQECMSEEAKNTEKRRFLNKTVWENYNCTFSRNFDGKFDYSIIIANQCHIFFSNVPVGCLSN